MALSIGPLAVMAQAVFPFFYCLRLHGFPCVVAQCAAAPAFFQRDRDLLPPPTAVVVV